MPAAIPEHLTDEERHTAIADLKRSADEFLNEIRGLSDTQWRFKPSEDVWSPAEIAEHVAIVEERIHWRIGELLKEPRAAEPSGNGREFDAQIRSRVQDRSEKRQAPPQIVPQGDMSLSDCIARFERARAKTLEFLDEPLSLRARALPHPVLGPLDGYQWILAGAGHAARHTSQLRELKADPNFPKA